MLPARDENRQISSNSAVADNLEVFSASKIVGSVDHLRRQLDGIELHEIASAERQISEIAEPLRHLEYVLGILATLIRCQGKISVAQEENIQAIEQVRLAVLSAHANPRLGLANLITSRSSESPERDTPAGGARIGVCIATSELGAFLTAYRDTLGESLTTNDELPPTNAPAEHLIAPASLQQAVDLPCYDPQSPAPQDHSGKMAAQELPASTRATDDATAEGRDAQAELRQHAPQNSDFDTKLLDDLIKNYGEFAAHPNLPATLDPSRQETRSQKKKPRLPREVSLRNPNDPDRQSKKLIQDHGEYDLYSSRRSALKSKLRVGGAFVALALVLGGIYYFSAPKTVAVPPAIILQQGDRAVKAREPEPASTSQSLSIQDENTRQAAGFDDLPQAFNKDITIKQQKKEKGGTKR